MKFLAALSCLVVLLLAGCGKSDGLLKVSGTVKHPDGSVPQGEISVIRFEPVSGGPRTKAASGTIQPDGSFTLTTIEPGDGAYPGQYKVTLSVWKTYMGREELLDEKYASAETTPLEATVQKNGERFDFTVEKGP